MTSSNNNLSEAYVDFVAGWVSGAVSVLICQPVDTVLTRFQASPTVTAAQQSSVTTSSGLMTSKSLQASTRSFVENYGKTALWRGSTGMISAVPFQNALLMGGYGLGKKWTEKSDHDGCDTNAGEASRPLIPIFVGGCTGGIAQSFLMSPVEYIKVQQQVVHPESASPTATLRQIMATAGPSSGARTPRTSGLSSQSSLSWTTRGLNATLLRDGIPHGVWFVAYEWCKGTMERTASKHVHVDVDLDRSTTTMNNSTTPSSTYQQLIVPITSGAFAATVAWAVGYPFDIIKTRIQSTGGSTSNRGIYYTGMKLVEEANGNIIRGLYRGFMLKLVRAVPASMIGFTTYEFVANRLA